MANKVIGVETGVQGFGSKSTTSNKGSESTCVYEYTNIASAEAVYSAFRRLGYPTKIDYGTKIRVTVTFPFDIDSTGNPVDGFPTPKYTLSLKMEQKNILLNWQCALTRKLSYVAVIFFNEMLQSKKRPKDIQGAYYDWMQHKQTYVTPDTGPFFAIRASDWDVLPKMWQALTMDIKTMPLYFQTFRSTIVVDFRYSSNPLSVRGNIYSTPSIIAMLGIPPTISLLLDPSGTFESITPDASPFLHPQDSLPCNYGWLCTGTEVSAINAVKSEVTAEFVYGLYPKDLYGDLL